MAAIKTVGSAKHKKMLAVLGEFRILFKSVRSHYSAVQRKAGISGAQLWALAHVADHPGILAGELARALAIHPSTASNLVRSLEKAGLLTKQRQVKDQRTVQLYVAPRGTAILKAAPRPLIGVLQQALLDLPVAKLEVLSGDLKKLVAAMKEKDDNARNIPLSSL